MCYVIIIMMFSRALKIKAIKTKITAIKTTKTYDTIPSF